METPAAGIAPNFKGPFFRWNVNHEINREKGTLSRFVVFSSGKRHAVESYLWLKLVWDQLSRKEFNLFLSLPSTLQNDKIVGFLRSKLEVKTEVLRKRLVQVETLIGVKTSSRERYIGSKRLQIEIQMETIRLVKVPKFSGYVKNISSLGKSSRGQGSKPEPTGDFLFISEENLDWFEILTVGEITLLGKSVVLLDKDQKVRNG